MHPHHPRRSHPYLYPLARGIQAAVGSRWSSRDLSSRSTALVKYRMTFWRAFNRLNWKWFRGSSDISAPSAYPYPNRNDRTNERTDGQTRETREGYIILLLLPLPHLDLSISRRRSTYPCWTPSSATLRGLRFSLFIFAHSLMRHIASCAGRNDVGRGKRKRGREWDWTGQSV